ncbi:hypothetical protein ACKVV7_008159 [Pyricularia oryzae]|nr:hypothetical protein MCOR01_007685 [Pyricularia oryzae]KAI6423111.1 hypothetical protein MCOR24_003820 [Pyricularia oryzae]KAI6529436.1 hypothetical protein MCOR16_004990 [Pyricularia oryzae]KAI6591877.1 hypothetical protein MCOR06_004462 [Pyricularia oryzae]
MIEERCDHLLTMSKGAVATGIKRIYDSCEEIFTGSKDTLDTLVQGGVLTRIYDAVGFGKGDFFKLDGSLTLSVATEFRRCRVETTVYGLGDELPTDPQAVRVRPHPLGDRWPRSSRHPDMPKRRSRDLRHQQLMPLRLRGDTFYLITGGFGGLRTVIATWMVEHGAKSIVFLSRSAGLKPQDEQSLSPASTSTSSHLNTTNARGHSVERLRYADPWVSTGQVVMGLRAGEDLQDPSTRTNWRCDRRMGFYHNATASPATLGEAASVDFLARQVGAKVFSPMLKEDDEVVDRSLTLQ